MELKMIGESDWHGRIDFNGRGSWLCIHYVENEGIWLSLVDPKKGFDTSYDGIDVTIHQEAKDHSIGPIHCSQSEKTIDMGQLVDGETYKKEPHLLGGEFTVIVKTKPFEKKFNIQLEGYYSLR